MITKDDVELAKTLYEQARTSALLAHDSWSNLINFRKTILESLRASGFSNASAVKEFEAYMDDHSQKYKSALDHMNNMSEAYGKLLDLYKKAST